MPQPTPGDVHVNRPLSNISIAYIQSHDRFIADQVFRNIPVQKQSDRYWTYDKSYWFRSEAQLRAPATETAGSGYVVDSTPTYFANVYGLHKDIDDQTRANTDSPLDADRDATEFVTQNMLLKRDQLWAAKYFVTGVWATERAGVGSGPTGTQFLQWDKSGSTPIEDITLAVIAVDELTGYRPNVLVVSPYVLHVLENHTLILDRIKYTERGIVSRDLLASLFGVDKLLVAQATNNTAVEAAAPAMSYIFGKHAALFYANPNPSILTPSAGYTFSWNGYLGASGLGTRMKRFRMEPIASDRIEIEMAFDFKLVATDMGFFFKDAVA